MRVSHRDSGDSSARIDTVDCAATATGRTTLIGFRRGDRLDGGHEASHYGHSTLEDEAGVQRYGNLSITLRCGQGSSQEKLARAVAGDLLRECLNVHGKAADDASIYLTLVARHVGVTPVNDVVTFFQQSLEPLEARQLHVQPLPVEGNSLVPPMPHEVL